MRPLAKTLKALPQRLRSHSPAMSALALFTLVALFIAPTMVLDSCRPKERVQPKPHWFKHYQHFHEKDYVRFIERQIGQDADSALTSVAARDFYRSRDYEPLWTRNGLQESLADSLLASLDDAYLRHGIPAAYFQTDSTRRLIEQLVEHQVPDDESLYAHLYRLERKLTDQYLLYANALRYGAVSPHSAHGRKWFYETFRPDTAFLRDALGHLDDFRHHLSALAPKTTEYQALQKEMVRLHTLQDTNETRVPDFRMHKNGRSENIVPLCTRLRQLGIPVSNTNNLLDDNILQAVNTFRRCNGIPESDTLDAETIEKLNRPLQYYKDAVAVNMERLRWQRTHTKEDDTIHIAVNIPDYTMCVVQKDSVVMRNRVCCGRTQNPDNNPARRHNGLVTPFKAETPLLYSQIRSIVLNPEWNIPYDIIKNEYYPKLVRSNTAVVNREHLYIKDSRTGRYVIPDSINWSHVHQGNIPYRLHQTSGRYNALGLYKFVFANTESVYLHDTNNKGAFKRRKRALSHGCVRVENPADVAEWVYTVNGFDTLYTEQLHIVSGSEPTTEKGEEFLEKMHEKDSLYYESLNDYDRQFYRKLRPTSVNLKKPIPLFIEYYTCFLGDDGDIQYRDDVYYKDGNILYLLEHPER